MPIGTLINTIAVLIGAYIGNSLQQKLPVHIQQTIFQAIGLCTLVIGFQMALQTQNMLIVLFSLLIGGMLGELLMLEKRIEKMLQQIQKKSALQDARFVQGLTTAFLIFCVGSMTILGALNEGLSGDRSLLLTKSVLDGFTAVALASTYGIGVAFSAIPLFLMQASLTILAVYLQPYLSPSVITELTSVGGILIIGIGIQLLEIKTIKILNLLPSLLICVLLGIIFL